MGLEGDLQQEAYLADVLEQSPLLMPLAWSTLQPQSCQIIS